jgi:hypothetical protein
MPIQFTNNIEKYMKSEKEKKRKIKEDDKNRNINQVNLVDIITIINQNHHYQNKIIKILI